jgi:hypothetical protein
MEFMVENSFDDLKKNGQNRTKSRITGKVSDTKGDLKGCKLQEKYNSKDKLWDEIQVGRGSGGFYRIGTEGRGTCCSPS